MLAALLFRFASRNPQNRRQNTQNLGVSPLLALPSKCAASPGDSPVLPQSCPLYRALERDGVSSTGSLHTFTEFRTYHRKKQKSGCRRREEEAELACTVQPWGTSKRNEVPVSMSSRKPKEQVTVTNIKVETSKEEPAWLESRKSPTLLLKGSAFQVLCVNMSGVVSCALIAKGEILLFVAAWMVIKGHVPSFTCGMLHWQVSQFRGSESGVRVEFFLSCHSQPKQ